MSVVCTWMLMIAMAAALLYGLEVAKDDEKKMSVYRTERFLENREIYRNDQITKALAGRRKPPDKQII